MADRKSSPIRDRKKNDSQRSDSQRIEDSSDSKENCRVWLDSSDNYGNPFCLSEKREAFIASTPRIPWFASIPRSIPYFASIPYIHWFASIPSIPRSYVVQIMLPKLITTKVVSLKKFYALFREEIDTLTNLIRPTTTTLEHLLNPSEKQSLARYLNMNDTLYLLVLHMQKLNNLEITNNTARFRGIMEKYEDQMEKFRFICTLRNVHIVRWAFYDWQIYMKKICAQPGLGNIMEGLANELYNDEFSTVLMGMLIDYLLALPEPQFEDVKNFMSKGITTQRHSIANLGQLRLVGYCLKVTNSNNYTESVKNVLRDYLVSDEICLFEGYKYETRNPAGLFFVAYIFSAIDNLELETLQALLNFGTKVISITKKVKSITKKDFISFCKGKYDKVTQAGSFDSILVELISRNRERFPAGMIDYMRKLNLGMFL